MNGSRIWTTSFHSILTLLILTTIITHVEGAQDSAFSFKRDTSVDIEKELMITDLAVIEDPLRTDPRNGRKAVWTFKYLMEQMAGETDPSEFVMDWLLQWAGDQEVNGLLSPARPAIWEKVIEPWLMKSGGEKLALSLAPFKLLAIVNRIDLRKHEGKDVLTAGEGRFVFGVLDPEGEPLPPLGGSPVVGGFTVIVEYELRAKNMAGLRQWAKLWHELGTFEIGSKKYNRHLERITKRFSSERRRPSQVNTSALKQIRTNEISLEIPWEMREFILDPDSDQLIQHTVARTPDFQELNGTPELAILVNENEADLLDGTFEFPQDLLAAATPTGPFTLEFIHSIPGCDGFPPHCEFRTLSAHPVVPGLSVFNIPWSAAGIINNDARHAFALDTCGGCHRDETGTVFLHIGFPSDHELPTSLGSPAALSGFLTGEEHPDPVESETIRHFNDLHRRQQDLEELLESLF